MIWLIGNRGMLGSDIAIQLEKNLTPFVSSGSEVNVSDIAACEHFFKDQVLPQKQKSRQYIINCSAWSNVDGAEDNHEEAYRLNADGPLVLAKLAEKYKYTLIHYSTDYVFDGSKKSRWKTDDEVAPVNTYGVTKLAGEKNIQTNCSKYFIIRIAWLYGLYKNNFITIMLKLMKEKSELQVVEDQIGAPTWCVDVANFTHQLIDDRNTDYGIWHFSSAGETSWLEYAQFIYKEATKLGLLDQEVEIGGIPASMWLSKAKRPSNSLFDLTQVELKYPTTIKPWQESVINYLIQYQNLINARE